ncbi:MAG: hypothetical protein AAF245_00405, partial [Pseudomonadota bacterium]
MAAMTVSAAGAQSTGDIPADRIPPNGWEDLQAFDRSGWSVLDMTQSSDVGASNVIPPDTPTIDAAARIEAVVAATGGNRILFFPAGDYYLATDLEITESNVVIRGAGKGMTRLNIVADTSENAEIEFRGPGVGPEFDITNLPMRGDQTVDVSNPSAFSTGEFIHIYDAGKVPKIALSGLPNITHYGQIVQITGISGSTLSLDMKLGLNFDSDPKLAKHGMLSRVGIERVSVLRDRAASSSRTNNIDFTYVHQGYANDVESAYVEQGGISAFMSKHIVIVNSDIHDAYDYGVGGQAYGVRIFYNTTQCRITNNKIWNMRHHIMLDRGANHCVISFNSTEPGYFGTTGDLNLHGFTPHNNLFEHNMGRDLKWDERSDPNRGQFQSIWAFGYRNRLTAYSGNRIRLIDPDDAGNRAHLRPTVIGNDTGSVSVATGTQERVVGANRINGSVVLGDMPANGSYPTSLYEASKPSFLGSKPWPLFGPSVPDFGTGNTVPAFDRAKVNSPPPSAGATCLSGTLTGSQTGVFSISNKADGGRLRSSSATGNVVLGALSDTNISWTLQDGNQDGFFGLINSGLTANLQANG